MWFAPFSGWKLIKLIAHGPEFEKECAAIPLDALADGIKQQSTGRGLQVNYCQSESLAQS